MTRFMLSEELSLAWLESSTIMISTFIGSLSYVLINISSFITNSRYQLETVCDSINTTSEQIFNTPFLLYHSILTTIVTTKENICKTLSTALFILEACIVWLIQTYKSTYRCLLVAAVQTVLSIVTAIVGPLQQAAQSITSFVTGGNNYQVGNWTAALTNVENNLNGWFNNSSEMIQQVVDTPFQILQQQLNGTLVAWQPTPFDFSHLQPQPQQEECDPTQLLNSLNILEDELSKLIKVLIGVLLIMLVVCVLANLLMTRFRYRHINRMHANLVKLYKLRPHSDCFPLMLDEFVDNVAQMKSTISFLWNYYHNKPYTRPSGLISRLFHYMCHPVAMYCFIVGFGGLLMTYSLIWTLEAKSQEILSDFQQETQQWTMNATAQWTNTANQQFDQLNIWINETENDLNQHTFGVIQSTAITLNNTLTSVVNDIQGLVQTLLGGTLLETSAQDLIQCLLLTKIENIEQGLTWITNHAHVNLPRINALTVNETILGSKMQDAITQHVMNTNWSLSLPLRAILCFYYILVIFWCFSLIIGITVQYIEYKKRLAFNNVILGVGPIPYKY